MTKKPEIKTLPHYPVYIPSKGRADTALTIKCLLKDKVPFYVVVEPQEVKAYAQVCSKDNILVLPWSGDDDNRKAYTKSLGIQNGGLIAVRNWIKDHSIANGAEKHWQIDDNIHDFYRLYKGKRMYCTAGVALAVTEDFVDRYENVAIAGLSYYMFAYATKGKGRPPFYLNVHVYSCTLVNNAIPHRWRLAYNDDTDICLQVLSDGWCTVLLNAFIVGKMQTMKVQGGNTADLYQGDGRLKMARELERMWPGVVDVGRRFDRPQHNVKNKWQGFDTPLKLKEGIDREQLKAQPVNEYGMKIASLDETKSEELKQWVEDYKTKHGKK